MDVENHRKYLLNRRRKSQPVLSCPIYITEAAYSKPTQGPTKLSEPRTLMSSTPWTSWRMNRSLRSCQCQQISPHRVAKGFPQIRKKRVCQLLERPAVKLHFVSFKNSMLDLNTYMQMYICSISFFFPHFLGLYLNPICSANELVLVFVAKGGGISISKKILFFSFLVEALLVVEGK